MAAAAGLYPEGFQEETYQVKSIGGTLPNGLLDRRRVQASFRVPEGSDATIDLVVGNSKFYIFADMGKCESTARTILQQLNWYANSDVDAFVQGVPVLAEKNKFHTHKLPFSMKGWMSDVETLLKEIGLKSKSPDCAAFLEIITNENLAEIASRWEVKSEMISIFFQMRSEVESRSLSAAEKSLDIRQEFLAGNFENVCIGLRRDHPSHEFVVNFILKAADTNPYAHAKFFEHLCAGEGSCALSILGIRLLIERYCPSIPKRTTLNESLDDLRAAIRHECDALRSKIKEIMRDHQTPFWLRTEQDVLVKIDRFLGQILAK